MRLTFFSIFLFLAFSDPASATTFSQFRVAKQIEEAPFIVRGRIVGKSWVQMDATTQRPYTYWNLAIQDSYGDRKLDGQVAIREAGGEMNGIGYYIPSSAEFQEGEDVVVMLRNSPEEAKEVVGLVSGKYDVLRKADGKEYLRNGLGIDLKDENGDPLGPDDFRALVARVTKGQTREADNKILINPATIHDHRQDSDSPPTNVVQNPALKAPVSVAGKTVLPDNANKPLQDSENLSDRQVASQSDFSWVKYAAIVIFLAVFVFLLRKFTRESE